LASFTEISNRNLTKEVRENILLRDNGIKLADFGSCRGIYSKQPFTVI
jgi:serine/threonine protein kinase